MSKKLFAIAALAATLVVAGAAQANDLYKQHWRLVH